ncbi:MAG: hypothetical protein SNG69_02205 [Rikenellaceae bacterium]
MGWIILMLIVAVIIIYCAVNSGSKSFETDAEKQLRLMKEQQAKEEQKKLLAEKRLKEQQEMDELIAQYGALTKTIVLPTFKWSRSPAHSIMIFDTTSTILILKKAFSYRDILNCTVADNSTTTQSSSTLTSNTTTDTGSMLGRAIIGGVLTGGVGAVVGAATAKKKTTTSSPQVNIVVKHDYTIQINVNSITEPLIKIHIGANEEKVNEIVSVLNVIISRNGQVNN